MAATCKTCGGSPGHHKPSLFDPNGVGDPGHKVQGTDMTTDRPDANTRPLKVAQSGPPNPNSPSDETAIEKVIATYLEGLHNPREDSLYNELRAKRDTENLKAAIRQLIDEAVAANDSLYPDKSEYYAKPMVEKMLAEARAEAVENAFNELKGTSKDSWYGTMPEILERLNTSLQSKEGDTL